MNIGMYGGKFLPLHMGHVNCIIEASNKCDILYVVLSHSKTRDKELCEIDDFKYIPSNKRMQWLDQIASSLPNVKIIEIEDFDGIDYNSWSKGADSIKDQIYKDYKSRISVVFGSELEYKDIFENLYTSSRYEIIDADRVKFNVSASKIRKRGVFKNWEFIPKFCRPYYNKKVVIVGTESCGKSTMIKKLALKYDTEFVSEYGRDMCERLNTGQPTEEYYPYIAYGQKMQEFEKNQTANKVLFIDTESTVTQFYNELYNNKQYDVLDSISKTHKYDLVIFLEPNVQWVNDGLRIHGKESKRVSNNNLLIKMLIKNNINIIRIKDKEYGDRYNKIIKLVDKLLI